MVVGTLERLRWKMTKDWEGFESPHEHKVPAEALEQPTNMVTIPLDKLEDMQRRLKEQPISHSCRSDGVCKCEQPTAEQSSLVQEPVAYFKKWEDKSGEHKDIKFSNSEGYKPLYTQPAPRPTQEPVLYIDEGGLDGHATWAQATRCQATDIALYTHPKEWQGLSDDELEELSSEEELMFWGFARAIEAKLKEKNG